MRKVIWLLLSSFGIMFAVFSWLQDMGALPGNIGVWKGVLALVSGIALFLTVAIRMETRCGKDFYN
jgi:hypothetical protein